MCALSYIWHGIILTDYVRLNIKKAKLLGLSSLYSFILAFIMVKVFEFDILERYFSRQPLFRGLLVGAVTGLIYYFVSTFFHFSFNTSTTSFSRMIDIGYQVFEQAIGGFVIGMVFIAFFDPDSSDN